MVSLTGDVATGKEIAKAAADTLKRVHLELGGKAPVVVFDDADLEAVVEGVKVRRLLQRRPGLHGRHPRARRAEDPRRLRRRPRRGGRSAEGGRPVRRGAPRWARWFGGAARARHRLPRARAEPRRDRRGRQGAPGNGNGFFLEPTVVDGLQQDDEMIQREIFGPVVTVQQFSSEDEAIA